MHVALFISRNHIQPIGRHKTTARTDAERLQKERLKACTLPSQKLKNAGLGFRSTPKHNTWYILRTWYLVPGMVQQQ